MLLSVLSTNQALPAVHIEAGRSRRTLVVDVAVHVEDFWEGHVIEALEGQSVVEPGESLHVDAQTRRQLQ